MMFDRAIAAFDIETIPDPDVGRRVMGLVGDDATVVHQMVEHRLKEMGGSTEYPQLPFHRVVTIGVAWLDAETKTFELRTVGGAAMDERSHLEGFFGLMRRRSKRPRLVSWNGRGFDLPVVRYRSVFHGIAAPELYRADDPAPSGGYQHRHGDLHVDLMDVLSGHGASRFVGLGRMCELLGIPGKQFLTEKLYDHIVRGEDDVVAEYCKLDCLDTLLCFLAWTIHTGDLTPDTFREYLAIIRAHLLAEEHPGWQEVAAGLEGWPSYLHG